MERTSERKQNNQVYLENSSCEVILSADGSVCLGVLAPSKLQSSKEVGDIEDAINLCLSDVSGDTNDVVDVIRKAIANNDDSRFVGRQVFTIILEVFDHC